MKFWKLEAIRGLAALYIVILHINQGKHLLFRFGQEAVIIFFILSGFVIEYSSYRRQIDTFKHYFLRRFIRIYPILIAMFSVVSCLKRVNLNDFEFLRDLFGNLLMLQDFGSVKPNVIVPPLFASALWSLHYEWWHYMIYYPVKTLVNQRKQSIFVGFMSILLAIAYVFYPIAPFRVLMYFPIWWTGVEMARSFIKHGKIYLKNFRIHISVLATICSVLALKSLFFVLQGNNYVLGEYPILETRHFAASIVVILLGIVWQNSNFWGANLLKLGTWIAPISYALYIAHQPLLVNARYLHFLGNKTLELSLYLVVLCVFCITTELLFYPYLRRKILKSS